MIFQGHMAITWREDDWKFVSFIEARDKKVGNKFIGTKL